MDEPLLFELDDPPNAAVQARLRARRRDWEVLAVSSFVMVLALALQVLPDQEHIAVRGFSRYPLPHVCRSRAWFGVKCPGCGLTRSFIHLARGDWHASLRAHRLGWVMAALVVLQIPYRVLSLRRSEGACLSRRACQAIAFTIIGLLIGNWLCDLAVRPASLAAEIPPHPRGL